MKSGKARSASLNKAQRPFAGVELGGTKCVCTLAFGPDEVVDQRTVPTLTPEKTLAAIIEIITEWRDGPGLEAMGIASFGPLDLDPDSPCYGRILATAKPHWPNTDVRGALSAHFDVPVAFDTDVNGAALAEIRWGSGKGLDDFAYVTVGTGVGVGLVVRGQLIRGLGHSEAGHVRVPRLANDDAASACPYHADCVEGLASGNALLTRLAGRSIDNVAPDDPVWTPIVHALAMMSHTLVGTVAPLRIALGGGVVERQPTLIARVEQRLVESLNGYQTIPRPYIVPPALGVMTGPMGSIALAADGLQRAAR